MSNKTRPQYADVNGSIINDFAGNIALASRSGAPTNSVAGYAIGALYQRTDGGSGTRVYVNEGTVLSTTWTPLGTGAVLTPSGIVRTGYTTQLGRGGTAKAGTTAGWVVNAGNNLGTIATMAASQTAGTLVVAIPNLHVGDTITGFSIYSSINSAGGAVTLDANLRSLTIAAGATGTDASISSITQVSVTAATASTATKSGLSTVVVAGVNYYLLITGTTAASTTIELSQIEVTVTTA